MELIVRNDISATFDAITPRRGRCTGMFAIYHIECELGHIASGSRATVVLEVHAPDVDGGAISVDGFTSAMSSTAITAPTTRGK